jgi:hypothetical protein
MSDSHFEKAWDEFKWERFLQEQERRTEKYIELLEKYIDHPQRDEIIAEEMGWKHLIDGDSRDWEEEVDASFDDDDDEDTDNKDEDAGFSFERHPIYKQAIEFNMELDNLLDDSDEKVREHPAMVALNTQATLATAKLSLALSDEQMEDLGMCIAYLKRALAALTSGLDSTMHLLEGGFITNEVFQKLRERIFGIRNDIVKTMGDYRAEFRRRHGRG